MASLEGGDLLAEGIEGIHIFFEAVKTDQVIPQPRLHMMTLTHQLII